MTVAPPHHFDADTALEPAGELRWRAWAPDHWFVGRGPNGGFLAGVAARAAEAAAGRPLRSLSLHFVASPAVGPLEVAATLERVGRSYTAASVRIEQEGRPMTLALATLGELPRFGRGLGRRRDAGGHAARGDPAGAARAGRHPGVHAQLRHALGARLRSGRGRPRPAAGSGRPTRARWTGRSWPR